MDTLRDRLAELAAEAPTGGAPPAELWARGRRSHRVRAAVIATTLLVVGAVGTGIGVRLADGDDRRSDPLPAKTLDITLPIEYPVGQDLPDLGQAPGPLVAVWLAPREPYTLDDDDPGRAPEAVGLVAEAGTFGTLPVDLDPWIYESPGARIALSPDGRRIAYFTSGEGQGDPDDETRWKLVVRDLVSGDEYTPSFEYGIRGGATWIDATRLVGHVLDGSDADGWLWEPGAAPKLVNPHDYLDGSTAEFPPFDVWEADSPRACASPTIRDDETGRSERSVLCDVRGVIGSEILLGHGRSGASHDPSDPDAEVVALDISDDADFPFDDPALRRVVVTSGAPYPVTFAVDLMAEVLDADGGAS